MSTYDVFFGVRWVGLFAFLMKGNSHHSHFPGDHPNTVIRLLPNRQERARFLATHKDFEIGKADS